MFKNIVLFAHKNGQMKSGVEKTPFALRKYIRNNSKVITTKIEDNLYKNLNNLYYENSKLKQPILTIGGDHSMSIATVADSLQKYDQELKVIWVDAHCDLNTYDSSPSKNYHGMPLSILTGLDIATRSQFSFLNHVPILNLKNLLYIGIRDIDPYEEEILNRYNIEYITSETVNTFPMDVCNHIQDFIDGSPVHLSFDVDSIDPTFIPSTGTPVSNGIDLETCKVLLNHTLQSNIVSMDVTELNLAEGGHDGRMKSFNNIKYLMKDIIL